MNNEPSHTRGEAPIGLYIHKNLPTIKDPTMASGHGIGGSVGRCYPFFAEFKECLKTEQVILSEDGKKSWKNNCWTVREDYFECLHSKKEWAMVRRVNEEEKRQAGHNKGSPSVPAVEVPVSPPLPMRGLANPDSLGRA